MVVRQEEEGLCGWMEGSQRGGAFRVEGVCRNGGRPTVHLEHRSVGAARRGIGLARGGTWREADGGL